MRRMESPSFTSMIDFFAFCCSRLIFFRVRLTMACLPSGPASAGSISKVTTEFSEPRIKSTVSSKRQPVTSTMALLPCPTPKMRSPILSFPESAAGPPGTNSLIVVYSSLSWSTAPIPSRDSFMEILKSSEARMPK